MTKRVGCIVQYDIISTNESTNGTIITNGTIVCRKSFRVFWLPFVLMLQTVPL